MESSQWETWNNLSCRKVLFLTVPHYQFLDACSGEKHTTYLCLWCPLSLKFKGIYVIDIVIKRRIIWWKDIYNISRYVKMWKLRTGLASFRFSLKPHVWNMFHTNNYIYLTRSRAQLVDIGMQTFVEKTHTKI